MGVPLIVPKGADRSWTRGFYRTINKIFRRMWWEQNCDKQVEDAAMNMILYGKGSVRVKCTEA